MRTTVKNTHTLWPNSIIWNSGLPSNSVTHIQLRKYTKSAMTCYQHSAVAKQNEGTKPKTVGLCRSCGLMGGVGRTHNGEEAGESHTQAAGFQMSQQLGSQMIWLTWKEGPALAGTGSTDGVHWSMLSKERNNSTIVWMLWKLLYKGKLVVS